MHIIKFFIFAVLSQVFFVLYILIQCSTNFLFILFPYSLYLVVHRYIAEKEIGFSL